MRGLLIARIRGIPIRLHWSLLAALPLLAIIFGGQLVAVGSPGSRRIASRGSPSCGDSGWRSRLLSKQEPMGDEAKVM